MAALLAKASFTGALAQVAAPVAAMIVKPVLHGALTVGTTPASTKMGSSSQGTPMDIDYPDTNHYNPDGLDENCAFVSMAYLMDPTGKNITAKGVVAMTEEMQPADGSGGVELETVRTMLYQVKAKEGRDYKILPWSTQPATYWCGKLKTKRFAIGFRRHNPAIPCKTLSREEGGTHQNTLCTVVANAHLHLQPQVSGHFVVYDSERLRDFPGYFDFQADGKPQSKQTDGDQWIEEHGVVVFSIGPDPNAMDER